jgi:acetyl esterase/lipase
MSAMSIRPFAYRLAIASVVLTLAGPFAGPAARAQQTLPLWPHGTPEPPQTAEPETDSGKPVSSFPAGHVATSLANVTVPTLTVYPPHHDNNGAAAIVFPGGGYTHLAWTKEGTATCDWLNALGMTCLLVKYRVPEPHYPQSYADLEDAQQAIRLARAHAADWHLDPTRIGVVGFSAGGNLAALLATHPDDAHIASTPAAPDAPLKLSARPDFAVLVYPAYLALDPAQTDLDPAFTPTTGLPPIFLTAAEDDKNYGRNALVYYRALLDAHAPAELHFYPYGGHGFGVTPKGAPAHWTERAATWLRLIGTIPTPAVASDSDIQPTPTTGPCPNPMPVMGRPEPKNVQPNQPIQPSDPACPPPS